MLPFADKSPLSGPERPTLPRENNLSSLKAFNSKARSNKRRANETSYTTEPLGDCSKVNIGNFFGGTRSQRAPDTVWTL